MKRRAEYRKELADPSLVLRCPNSHILKEIDK